MGHPQKPEKQSNVGIEHAYEFERCIDFWAEAEAVEALKAFGAVMSWPGCANKYRLTVDARYNFKEVVEFVRNSNRSPENAAKSAGPPQVLATTKQPSDDFAGQPSDEIKPALTGEIIWGIAFIASIGGIIGAAVTWLLLR